MRKKGEQLAEESRKKVKNMMKQPGEEGPDLHVLTHIMSVLQQQLELLESELSSNWKDSTRQAKRKKRRRLQEQAQLEQAEREAREARRSRNVRALQAEASKSDRRKAKTFEALSKPRIAVDVNDAERKMEVSSLFDFGDDDEMVEKPELESIDEDAELMAELEQESSGEEVKIFRFAETAE